MTPMICPGNDLKFRITATAEDVDLGGSWTLTVCDPCGRRLAVTADECFRDSEGRWYFTVERVVRGRYFARFDWAVPDGDFDALVRNRRDVQPLADVGICGPRAACRCPAAHPVAYEQVWTADLDDGTYLCGSDGVLILTADGRRIKVM